MNRKLLDKARDADLRLSHQALKRAAQRARALARQTGTLIIVSRNGVLERIDPVTEIVVSGVQEPVPEYRNPR